MVEAAVDVQDAHRNAQMLVVVDVRAVAEINVPPVVVGHVR